MPDITGKASVDRLSVIVSGYGIDQLLPRSAEVAKGNRRSK